MKKLLCVLFLGISALSFGMEPIQYGSHGLPLPNIPATPPGVQGEQELQELQEIHREIEEAEFLERLRELERNRPKIEE